MPTKWIVMIVCFASFSIMAQHTFFKRYSYLDFGSKNSVELYTANQLDTTFVLIGIRSDHAFGRNYPIVSMLNKSGQLISNRVDSTFFSAYYLASCLKDQNLYVAGNKLDAKIGSLNQTKILAKYSDEGELIWSKPFGDSSHYLFDNDVKAIFPTETGLVVFGNSYGGAGTTDAVIAFLDNDGNLLYRKLYSTDESLYYTDRMFDVSQQEDGYVILIESIEPNANPYRHYLLLKTDLNGNEIWRKDISNFSFGNQNIAGLTNNAYCISPFRNNSTVILFSTEDNVGSVSEQLILAEFDFNGDLVRSTICLNDSNDYTPYDLRYTNDKNELFIFGAKAGDDTQNFDVSVAKFNADFGVLWNKSWGYDDNEIYNGVSVVTSDGGILIGGSILRYTIPQGFDFFLVKTDCNGNLEWDNQSCVVSSEEEVIVFGNPVQDEWLMHFPQLNADDAVEYELINSIGQIVLKGVSLGPIFNENVSNLSVGMYAFQLQFSGGKSFVGKVMKY